MSAKLTELLVNLLILYIKKEQFAKHSQKFAESQATFDAPSGT